jgi:hypothetical protein
MWKERRIESLPRWPKGVRLPIIISPHHQSEEMSSLYPDGQPDGFDFSERQYGGRRGAWRLLEVMENHGVKGTWLICGATAEKYPEVSRAVKKAGNAIAGHTYEHEMMCNLPAAVELELMKKTVTVFEDLFGERLRGWRTCFASHNTIDLILQHFDFEWDGSMWNDDLPYLLEGHGRQLVEIPFAAYSDVALCSQRFQFNTYSTWNCASLIFLRGLKPVSMRSMNAAQMSRADAANGSRLRNRPAIEGESFAILYLCQAVRRCLHNPNRSSWWRDGTKTTAVLERQPEIPEPKTMSKIATDRRG